MAAENEDLVVTTMVEVRLISEFEKCANVCNQLYTMYAQRVSRCTGRYADDDTAKSWLRLIDESYNRAKLLHFIRYGQLNEDGSLPGIRYIPGVPSYVGKAS